MALLKTELLVSDSQAKLVSSAELRLTRNRNLYKTTKKASLGPKCEDGVDLRNTMLH
jgi:hypothetical protein